MVCLLFVLLWSMKSTNSKTEVGRLSNNEYRSEDNVKGGEASEDLRRNLALALKSPRKEKSFNKKVKIKIYWK